MENKIIACHIRNLVDEDTDALAIISHLNYNAVSVDRFGYLNQYSNYLIQNTEDKFIIPDNYKGNQEEFNILVNNRVNELIKLLKNDYDKVYISWSGGIDSTLVLISFLKSDIDKDKIVVLYSRSSIQEYPLLFDLINKQNIKKIELTPQNLEYYYRSCILSGIIVIGDHADLQFPSIYTLKRYSDVYNTPYKDFLYSYIKNDLKYTKFEAIDQIEEAIHYYNLPVTQTCELLFFIDFLTEWNRYRIYSGQTIIGEISKNFITFFDTIEFQKWCLSRFDLIKRLNTENPKLYKLEMKKLIYDYLKDDDYINNKTKEFSFGKLLDRTYILPSSILTTNYFKVFDKFDRLTNRCSKLNINKSNYIYEYIQQFRKHLN